MDHRLAFPGGLTMCGDCGEMTKQELPAFLRNVTVPAWVLSDLVMAYVAKTGAGADEAAVVAAKAVQENEQAAAQTVEVFG